MKILNNILKIIGIISIILPLIVAFVFIKPQNTLLSNDLTSYDINYILLIGIELLNIIFTILLFIKKDNIKKWICLVFCIYIIISAMIPVYHIRATKAPNGPNSHLM